MAAAFALAIISGNNIFIFVSPKRLRSFRRYFFTGKVVTANGISMHFPVSAFFVKMCLERPCGCAAMKAAAGLSSRRAVCISRWKGFALTSVEAATNTKNKNSISAKYAQSAAEAFKMVNTFAIFVFLQGADLKYSPL